MRSSRIREFMGHHNKAFVKEKKRKTNNGSISSNGIEVVICGQDLLLITNFQFGWLKQLDSSPQNISGVHGIWILKVI